MNRMPIIFIGHGSPMNAIEDNEFTQNWINIFSEIPKPKAILAISAHWYTEGTKLVDTDTPKMIYDMYGFPKELYEINYKAPGSSSFAHLTKSFISKEVQIDNSWGFDHGTWSILHKVYKSADIPVFQLSIDKNASPKDHFKIGQEIKSLREQGVLIFASGNVVHNLARVNFGVEGGYDFSYEFDNYIKNKIIEKDYDAVINYKTAGKSAELSFTTPEHFYPLLYILGAVDTKDQVRVFNDACVYGSLSMTSYLFR